MTTFYIDDLISVISDTLSPKSKAVVASGVINLTMTNNDFGGLGVSIDNSENIHFEDNSNTGLLEISDSVDVHINRNQFMHVIDLIDTTTLSKALSALNELKSKSMSNKSVDQPERINNPII